MKRELKEWKKGRKRSILPGVVFLLFIALFALAIYVNGLVQERSFREELMENFHGDFVVTGLLFRPDSGEPQEPPEQRLPFKLSISEAGGIVFDETTLFGQSEMKITKVGKQQKMEFAEKYKGFSENDPLKGKKSYYITFQTETDNAAGIYYIDGRLLFTPDEITIYEIKLL